MEARQPEMSNCQRETRSQVGGQTCKQKHTAMEVLEHTVMGPQGEEQQPPPPTPRESGKGPQRPTFTHGRMPSVE